jgi:uncharacterized protein
MKIELTYKPKNPIIIEGFPGFGLVGTIATEFLIKHLNAKPIGKITSSKLLPIAALHESKVVDPLGIYYDKKYNIVIIHALSAVRGLEWLISDALLKLCKDINCKELISIEGIGSQENKLKTFYYSNNPKNIKKFHNIGLEQLKEGMVLGVTGALLLKNRSNVSCVFVESHVSVADSMAAAKVVEVLDKYLGLKVDYKPLIQAAEKFEKTLKVLMEKSKQAVNMPKDEDSHKLDYLG